MTVTTTTRSKTRRPSVASRRAGYLVGILVNAALLYAVNVWPGWEAVPFLNGDTIEVLGLVNASMVAGMLANALYLARDPKWFRSLGDIVTTAVGLAAMVQIWNVFPFSFAYSDFDWALVVRLLLVVGIVGSVIGIVVAFVSLVTGTRSRS